MAAGERRLGLLRNAQRCFNLKTSRTSMAAKLLELIRVELEQRYWLDRVTAARPGHSASGGKLV
jgi:hypothetical protein